MREAIGEWEQPISLRTIFGQAAAAWRWLFAAVAIVILAYLIGAGFGFQVILVALVAAYWTASEYSDRSDEGVRLREEHPDWPSQKADPIANLRWGARYVMWLGFLAAPCFLAATFVNT